jgi:hypothetical protein
VYAGESLLTFCMVSLMLEVSTIFMSAKWFISELKLDHGLLPLINNTMFFLSYLAIRVMFQTFISYSIIYPEVIRIYSYSDDQINALGKHPQMLRTGLSIGVIVQLLSIMTNYYWCSLVWKTLKRTINKTFKGEKVYGDSLDNLMRGVKEKGE